MSFRSLQCPDPNAECSPPSLFLNKFTVPVSGFKGAQTGHSHVVRLTAKGDRALFDLCQERPSEGGPAVPFVRVCCFVGALTAKQLRTARPSYVNAVPCSMNTRSVSGEHVRIPGHCNGASASSQLEGRESRCDCYSANELKYVPSSVADLSRAPIEELED
ncbi:hypothetical protein BDW66DRAFT_160940 [Aspergillus desertorum]